MSFLFSKPTMYLAGFLAIVGGLYWVDAAIRDNERQRIANDALVQGFRRTGVSDENAESFRKLSEKNKCLVISHQSGLLDSPCEGLK